MLHFGNISSTQLRRDILPAVTLLHAHSTKTHGVFYAKGSVALFNEVMKRISVAIKLV